MRRRLPLVKNIMTDEGYIKFHAEWTKGEPLPAVFLEDLIEVRLALRGLGLIGAYPDGVGFGNISKRWDAEGRFVISGTATGHLEELGAAHFTLVTDVFFEENRLCCRGPILASSESMSHAAVYRQCPEVGAVVHIHSLSLWEKCLGIAPTTDAGALYGTPEMAFSIARLLEDPQARAWQFLVMSDHREGCIAFGKDLREALEVIYHKQ